MLHQMPSRSLADITETLKGNTSETQNAERKIRRYSTSKDLYSINSEAEISRGAWGSVVVKALRYYSEGPGIDSRWCHWGFFPWLHPTEPC